MLPYARTLFCCRNGGAALLLPTYHCRAVLAFLASRTLLNAPAACSCAMRATTRPVIIRNDARRSYSICHLPTTQRRRSILLFANATRA